MARLHFNLGQSPEAGTWALPGQIDSFSQSHEYGVWGVPDEELVLRTPYMRSISLARVCNANAYFQ